MELGYEIFYCLKPGLLHKRLVEDQQYFSASEVDFLPDPKYGTQGTGDNELY